MEPLRDDSTAQRLKILPKRLRSGLFWGHEAGNEHCRRQHNVEPGVGWIIGDHPLPFGVMNPKIATRA